MGHEQRTSSVGSRLLRGARPDIVERGRLKVRRLLESRCGSYIRPKPSLRQRHRHPRDTACESNSVTRQTGTSSSSRITTPVEDARTIRLGPTDTQTGIPHSLLRGIGRIERPPVRISRNHPESRREFVNRFSPGPIMSAPTPMVCKLGNLSTEWATWDVTTMRKGQGV